MNLKLSNVELMYTLQVILGNGMVGTNLLREPGFLTAASPQSGGVNDFIIAPSGNLVVDKIPLFTHQIAFVYRFK